MADGDVITLGTAKFQEVNMIPHNVLLRYDSVVVGDIRFSRKLASNLYLECTTAGTTAATEPTITGKVEGNTITDGTAVWTVKKFGSSGGKREPFLSATAASSDGYTYNISRRGNGSITAVSSNTSVGTVSVSGTTVTVTPVANGDITVTVSVAETNEYYSDSVSVTVNCNANIYGIALISQGGGSGTWKRVTQTGDNLPNTIFSNVYPWNEIESVTIDGQAMVKIPKFYVKYGTIPNGMDNAGKNAYWISEEDIPGYHIHPAFVRNGQIMDCFYIGAYEAYNAGSNKLGSAKGKNQWTLLGGFENAKTLCTNRNTNANDTAKSGWHMQNIYEVGAVNLLMLIELGTPDVQTAIAMGNVASGAAQATGATAAVWRDLHEWWGNINEHVDGITTNANGVYQIFSNQGNDTYVSTGVTAPNDGWITGMSVATGTNFDLSDVFLPLATNSTESKGTYGDRYITGKSTIFLRGGFWNTAYYDNEGRDAGAFFFKNGEANTSNSGVCTRLAKYGVAVS